MFEEQLLIFCHQKNITTEEFYTRCRNVANSDDKTEHYISILLSSCEYDTFVRLMKIMRPVAQMKLDQLADAKPTTDDSDEGTKSGGNGSKSDSKGDELDEEGGADAKGTETMDSAGAKDDHPDDHTEPAGAKGAK